MSCRPSQQIVTPISSRRDLTAGGALLAAPGPFYSRSRRVWPWWTYPAIVFAKSVIGCALTLLFA